MAKSIICERAEVFTPRILALSEKIRTRGLSGQRIANELSRCGPSIGANANEAQDGQTKPDFIAKMCVSRKEARETVYWLRMAIEKGVVKKEEVAWELREAGELRAMLVAAVKTAQSNPFRGENKPDADEPQVPGPA